MDLKDFGTRFEAALVELLTLQDEFFKSGGIEKSPSEIKIQDEKKIELYFKREDCSATASAYFIGSRPTGGKGSWKKITLKAGAIIKRNEGPSLGAYVKAAKELRAKLFFNDLKLTEWAENKKFLILNKDEDFSSPSVAAAFILGFSTGYDGWFEKDTNRPLKEIIKEP